MTKLSLWNCTIVLCSNHDVGSQISVVVWMCIGNVDVYWKLQHVLWGRCRNCSTSKKKNKTLDDVRQVGIRNMSNIIWDDLSTARHKRRAIWSLGFVFFWYALSEFCQAREPQHNASVVAPLLMPPECPQWQRRFKERTQRTRWSKEHFICEFCCCVKCQRRVMTEIWC